MNAQSKLLNLIDQHNAALQSSSQALANLYQDATIGVLDMYTPLVQMAQNQTGVGFSAPIEEPCYGAEEYTKPGTPGMEECTDPEDHLFWDWLHLTTRAQETMATSLLSSMNGVITNSALLHAKQQTAALQVLIQTLGPQGR